MDKMTSICIEKTANGFLVTETRAPNSEPVSVLPKDMYVFLDLEKQYGQSSKSLAEFIVNHFTESKDAP